MRRKFLFLVIIISVGRPMGLRSPLGLRWNSLCTNRPNHLVLRNNPIVLARERRPWLLRRPNRLALSAELSRWPQSQLLSHL